MIIVGSRPFYSRLYISDFKLCQELRVWQMDGGRGSRVACCRVCHTRNINPRPATISQTFQTDILILLFSVISVLVIS